MSELSNELPIFKYPPLPGGPFEITYPLAKMEIGDSIFVRVKAVGRTRSEWLRSYISRRGKSLGMTFTVRQTSDDEGKRGYRIWRCS